MSRRGESFWSPRNRWTGPLVGLIAVMIIDAILSPLRDLYGLSRELSRFLVYMSLISVMWIWYVPRSGHFRGRKQQQQAVRAFGIGSLTVIAAASLLFHRGLIFADSQSLFEHISQVFSLCVAIGVIGGVIKK